MPPCPYLKFRNNNILHQLYQSYSRIDVKIKYGIFLDNKITSVEVFPPLPVQSISFRNNKITRIADR